MVTTGRWDEEVPPPARRPLGEPGTAIPRYGLLLPGACDVRAALLRVLRIDDAEVAWAAARTAADVAEDVDTFTPAQLERAATALVELGGDGHARGHSHIRCDFAATPRCMLPYNAVAERSE